MRLYLLSAFLLCFAGARPGLLHAGTPPPDSTRADSVVFATDHSFFYHLLALPATVVDRVTSPIGGALRWAERERIKDRVLNRFLGPTRTAGVYPRVQVGGDRFFAGGLTLFHNDLFGAGHEARVGFLYAGPYNGTAGLSYTVPPTRDRPFFLDVAGRLNFDPEENFFPSMAVDTRAERLYYEIRRGVLGVQAGYRAGPHLYLTAQGDLSRTRIATPASPGDGQAPLPIAAPGFGTHDLGHVGASLVLDFRRGLAGGAPQNVVSGVRKRWSLRETIIRPYAGTLLDVGAGYHRTLGSDTFTFVDYHAEVHQFVPLPWLPRTRRLALRARLDKRYGLHDSPVPFYALSILGGSDNLRGYDEDRFRDLGALYFNLEYRYPFWDLWDAVLFLDEGQVFADYRDLALADFRWAVGTGLRFMTAGSFLFRVEVAYSPEAIRGLLAFSTNF